MIEFKDVNKTFEVDGKVVNAVQNVNLTIKDGEIFGIIGFSGAGKSTLVRMINMLEKPTSGQVVINGTEITSLKGKALRQQRKKIGMIFQHFNLFSSRTVGGNIAFAMKKKGLSKLEIDKKVDELLDIVGLSDKKEAYPSQLSGGQKQRVAIARALATDPDILLSDESTSALDPRTTSSILQLLKEVNERLGITIVVITHEMQVVKEICDRVAVMENGNVVESGDVFQIFANPVAEITKEFVDSTTTLSRIYQYIKDESEITKIEKGEVIVRFRYLERNSSEALVSMISRKFNLDVNIIFGDVELIGENPIGGLVSIIRGDQKNIQDALTYLKEKNVGVEVIKDARVA
ncbi:MAG: ATP-binding cassette domain-containing protein [Eubacteriales bacterium]|nr:ATP-binding cassette domain-containing protein [Eubacteriales bacterium]